MNVRGGEKGYRTFIHFGNVR